MRPTQMAIKNFFSMMSIIANGGDTLEGIITILQERERRCALVRESQRKETSRKNEATNIIRSDLERTGPCSMLHENNLQRQLLPNKQSKTPPLPLQSNQNQSKINSPQTIHRTILGVAPGYDERGLWPKNRLNQTVIFE